MGGIGGGALTCGDDVVDARRALLADGVGGRTDEAAEIQIRTGEVAGHAAAAFVRPGRSGQFDYSGRTVEGPAEGQLRRRIGVQIADDARLLVTGHAVHSVLTQTTERRI